MKLPGFAKFGLKLVIGAGVNEVLKNIITSTTPADLTKTRQIMVKIGKYAITTVVAGLIADKTVNDIDEMIQEITTTIVSPSVKAANWAAEEMKKYPGQSVADEPITFHHDKNTKPIGKVTDISVDDQGDITARVINKLLKEVEDGGTTD